MTVALAGANGGLGERLGAIIAGVNDLNSLRGGSTTTRVLAAAQWPARLATLFTDYAASVAQLSTLNGENPDGSYGTAIHASVYSWTQQQEAFLQALQLLAQNTLIAMVNTDTPMANPTLFNACVILIQQMLANTVAVSAAEAVGGSSYQVGDVLTLSGGTHSVAAQFTVASLSGSAVATVTLLTAGSYTVQPSNPVATTGGSGNGACTLNVTWTPASFNASVPAAGAQTAIGTAVGNAIIVTSVVNAQGLTLQYVYPETATFVCSADSQTGSATEGQEQFTITTPTPVTDKLSYLWPGGSGANFTLNAVDGSVDNASQSANLLTNSDFQKFTTANYPDNWTIITGAASILNGGAGNAYTPSGGSLEIVGDGSTLHQFVQSFSTTPVATVGVGGTAGALLPDTVYGFNCFLKMSATPSTGVLTFSIQDHLGNILNDDQGNPVSFTKSLTAVSTSFVNVHGVFRTPNNTGALTNLPPRLSIAETTAIATGKNLFLCRASLTLMTQIYAGGPFVSIHSGSTPVVQGFTPDTWTVAYTNTWGTFQEAFEQLFGMNAMGLTFPGNTTPSVADGLIA